MSNILDDLENQVSSSWNSISSAGAPAVVAGAENYAAGLLSDAAKTNQAASQQAVNKAVAAGGQTSGIIASIQGVLGQVAQGTVFKQYGLQIIIGGILFIWVVRRL